MSRTPKHLLLVEGDEDKRVLPWLIERAGVNWGPKDEPVVTIEAFNGVEKLLAAGVIETYLKQSGLLVLGVIVDADEDAAARWQSISARISGRFQNLPKAIPTEGFVVRRGAGPAFGAWIMPDNISRGMMETFLLFLRPDTNLELQALSCQVVEQAKRVGAPFSPAHQDKAQIHSWLAWQDPPGAQLHNAIIQGMLRAASPSLTKFIEWFCSLYELPKP